MRGRVLAFVALCIVCAVGAAAYVRRAANRSAPPESGGLPPWSGHLGDGAPGLLLFRNTALDAYGILALTPQDHPSERRGVAALSCERVDYAAGRGVCLSAARGVLTTYSAIVFDESFHPLFRLGLAGSPSRVRVSPDGKRAAATVFVQGHSYAGGNFSTQTSLIDLTNGQYAIADFEQLTVSDGDKLLDAADRNFWGVTFARDSDRFYATLGTGGHNYLIQGRMSERSARAIGAEGECPSLSPDNTRLAFKRRVEKGIGPVHWQLAVLDLATLEEVVLAEKRGVDDQVYWLDDRSILYALPAVAGGSAETDTWVVNADGSGEPRLFLPNSYSTVQVAASALPSS